MSKMGRHILAQQEEVVLDRCPIHSPCRDLKPLVEFVELPLLPPLGRKEQSFRHYKTKQEFFKGSAYRKTKTP